MEKNNAKEKQWVKIKCSDGSFCESIDGILKEQVIFYSKLFTSEGWDNEAASDLLSSVEVKLTQQDKDILEENITENEIKTALFSAKNNKSSGENGIISGFYKVYRYLIKDDFMGLIKKVSITMNFLKHKKGLISLLYKC